jgi:HD-GYP domain-containing protein (c-di-GMP phosphodiesterase class II)
VLILPIHQAIPGMKLAAPVTHPENPDQELLRRGYTLEDSVLKRMKSVGVEYIYVDYPGLDDLDKHLAPNLSPERQKVYTQIKDAITSAQRQTKPICTYAEYYSGTRELITTLMSQGRHPVYLDQMTRLGGDMVGHGTAVAHLALILGIKLETYLISERKRLAPHLAKEVVNLGVAGMLHDIGKVTGDAKLRTFSEAEPPAEPELLEAWQNHPRAGYELIREGIEPTAASAVLHHHQRFDGTGFPATKHKDGTTVKPSGKTIHIFARILYVADLYDRLAKPMKTPQRSNLQIHDLLRKKYAAAIDPAVYQTLVAVCPPVPPGTQVTLSDGSKGIVTQVDGDDPYHPLVRRVGADGLTLEGAPFKIGTDPGIPRITTANGLAVDPYLPPEMTLSAVA